MLGKNGFRLKKHGDRKAWLAVFERVADDEAVCNQWH